MSLDVITPQKARELIAQGAVFIDVREPDEHARERIPGAHNHPVSALSPHTRVAPGEAEIIVFHCRSGARTVAHGARLKQAAGCDAYILDGGLDAWKKAGFDVEKDSRQPLELQRQVQIAAGGMIVLGGILGVAVDPWFFALSVGVGAGLVFAGVTGVCGLARFLRAMPWNRALRSA
ncbi:rhodanese family protein [Futiania mangrovi]|uniref:Rhodanese family protein n=1 Tax=Futiania mangrovi TaxID=2959716 RepID=A0A9J6PAK4_9PROT|nr:rhodanese family protein [Futiania mangrovii]MCP1335078.1 rhodanese family protein [Futiania mangrovii]